MKLNLIALLCAAALVACGQPASDSSKEKKGSADNQGGESGTQPAPVSPFGLLGSLMSAQSGPGPYEALESSESFSDDDPHLAVIDLSGPIVERKSFSLFGGMSGTELFALTQKLGSLAEKPQVKGLLLRVGELPIDMAVAEELRLAIDRFKTAGKDEKRKVYCHIAQAQAAAYYVVTACDEIAMAPTGMVQISGPAAMPIHVKGLLDKLGLRADFVHIGAYKGAAEPLTRETPSPAMRETLQSILDDTYAVLVAGIAAGRDLSEADAKARIDRALFQGEEAVEAKLVDEIATFGAFRDRVADGIEWTMVSVGKDKKPADFSQLMALLGMEPRTRDEDPHVAVVYAVGPVVDGEGGGIAGARERIASRTLSTAILRLAEAESVKAIVLRISSGGGSALASEIIWHAIDTAKKKKPVIVSMGRVAASGGYYIASGATKIYALKTTLTGSIGVVGGKIVVDKALGKLGVEVFPMGRGERALMWSPTQMWSDSERKAVKSLMAQVYETFKGRVAAGRDLDGDTVETIAQGRVWTGIDAKDKGLVDEIGGLSAAIAEARKLADVPADAAIEVYPPAPTLMDMLQSVGSSGPLGASAALAAIAEHLGPEWAQAARRLLVHAAIVRDAGIVTATMLPAALAY